MTRVVVDHPLLVPNKVQLVLLEALLGEVLHATMGHLAESVGVSPGVVGADIPLDLLVRARLPLRHKHIGPVILLSVEAEGIGVTVVSAAVSKVAGVVTVTSSRDPTSSPARTKNGGCSLTIILISIRLCIIQTDLVTTRETHGHHHGARPDQYTSPPADSRHQEVWASRES